MKKLFTLLVICASLRAHAQVHKNLAPEQSPEVARILAAQIARGTTALPAAKGTQIKQRLVGFSYRNIGGPLQDSVALYYSGYNGSDSLRDATWDDYYNEYYGYYSSGKSRIQPDSLRRWPNTLNGSVYTNIRQYDAFKNIISSEYLGANNSYCTKYISTYSNSGRQQSSIQYDTCGIYTPTQWHTYNSDGNILKDSFPSQTLLYYYSGTQLDSSKWVFKNPLFTNLFLIKYQTYKYYYNNGTLARIWQISADSFYTHQDTVGRTEYFYDNLGRIDSVLWFNPPFATPSGGTRYQYSGNFMRPTDIRYYNGFMPGPSPQPLLLRTHYQYHLNSTGNWDTVYFHRVTNGVDTLYEKDPIVYNAAGFIDYVSGYTYNSSTNTYSTTPYDRNQYYYETYNDPTAVQSPVLSAGTPGLFPNPAKDQLHILCTGAWDISDANGRVVASGHAPGILNVANWRAGIYYLRSNDRADKFIKE